MSKIQETVSLESENDNLIAILLSTIIELDWMIIARDKSSIRFREKRRFDHFNHVEGMITVDQDRRTGYDVINLEAWNNGIGSIQEEFLRGKVSEFMLVLKDRVSMERLGMDEGAPKNDGITIAEEIKDLSRLYDSGALTYDEFKRAKNRLLDG
jgi:hypothetical protein